MKIFLALIILCSQRLFAHEHGLGAHEHGAIKLEMGIEKSTVELDLDGPAEAFIGFEYLPHSVKEKAIMNNAKNLWEKNLFTLINFDQSLKCQIIQASFTQVIDQKEHGNHSDIEAKAKVSCNGDLAGSNVQVSLKKYFKNIKKLKVDVVGKKMLSIDISSEVQSFKI